MSIWNTIKSWFGKAEKEVEAVVEAKAETVIKAAEEKAIEVIKEKIDAMLKMDASKIDAELSNGHDWAGDHITSSRDDIEEVYNWLISRVKN